MIGNNSCGVHSVMAGKTDDNVLELDVLAYDGTRLRVGPTTDEQLRGDRGRRRPPGRDLPGACAPSANAMPTRSALASRTSRGGSPATTSPQLLAEHQFNVAAALVGSEFDADDRARGEGPPRPQPARPDARRRRLSDDVFAAGDDVARIVQSGRIACEGMDEALVRDVRARGIHPDATRAAARGHGFLLVEFGGADRGRSGRQGARFRERPRQAATGRIGPSLRRSSRRGESSGRSASRASA